MKLRMTKYFKNRYVLLRTSQKDDLKKAVQTVSEKPELGTLGKLMARKEEQDKYRFYTYEDHYGKMMLCYRHYAGELWLVSLHQISIKL